MKTSKVEAKNKIAIRGDRNEPIIVALTDLMLQNREFYDELKKVIDIELWDGYHLNVCEEQDNPIQEKGWLLTTEYGDFIDSNSPVGYSYRGVDRYQCPNCKTIYPTTSYFAEANFCPHCGTPLGEPTKIKAEKEEECYIFRCEGVYVSGTKERLQELVSCITFEKEEPSKALANLVSEIETMFNTQE